MDTGWRFKTRGGFVQLHKHLNVCRYTEINTSPPEIILNSSENITFDKSKIFKIVGQLFRGNLSRLNPEACAQSAEILLFNSERKHWTKEFVQIN